MINAVIAVPVNKIVETISETHSFNTDRLFAVNTSDVENGVILTPPYLPVSELKGQFKKTIQNGDILFSEIRPANKHFAVVNVSEPDKYVASTKLMVLRKYNDSVDAQYFYYWLTNTPFLNILQRRAENRICSFPQITFELLSEYSVPVPDMPTQKAVASLLATIDSKISNNTAICSDLEAMAKLLYDYWFNQFDFPDENGKPYKSSGGKMVWHEDLKREIPAGWQVKRLPDIASLQYGFPLSTTMFGADGIGVVRIRDILDNSISAYTTETVSDEYYTHEGDLLVGMDGNFQMNYWTREGDIVNQRITRIRKHSIPLMIIKMQIEPYINTKIDSVARSTVGHLGDADFKQQPILVPTRVNMQPFELFLQQIIALRKENQQLASLRDFLLPMLMNGQVSFKALDK